MWGKEHLFNLAGCVTCSPDCEGVFWRHAASWSESLRRRSSCWKEGLQLKLCVPQRETCAMALEKELLKSLSSAEAAGIKFLLGFPFPPLFWLLRQPRSLLVWGHLEALGQESGAGPPPWRPQARACQAPRPPRVVLQSPWRAACLLPKEARLCWVLACRSELGTSQPLELGLPVCKRQSRYSLARGLWRKQGFRASQGLYVGFATRTPLSPLPPVKVELI